MPTVRFSGRGVEDGGGGLGVDVLAAQEDVAQHLLVGDVGEDPQLDLRVVDADQAVAGLGDEAAADLAAGLGADRDVLEVRVDRGEPAGGGVDLQERRVQAAVVADPVGERVEVGLDELGELPEALDLGDDRVLVADRLQDAGVGGEAGLAAALARQAELLEQDLAELLGRADHELLAGVLPDLALELVGVGADAGGDRLELGGVELDALLLGLAQDVDERELDVGQEVDEAALVELGGLLLGERVDEHGAGALLVVRVDGEPALLAQLVERVAAAGGVEQVGGDLGVEDEVGRDVAERLGVVGDDRAFLGGGDELGGVVDRADQRVAAAGVGAEAPLGLARDQLALGDLGGERDERERVAAEHVEVLRAALADGDGLGGRLLGPRDRLGLELVQRLLEPAQRVAQLPLPERLAQADAVGPAGDLRLEVEVDGDVEDDRRELLGDAGVLGVVGEVLLALGAGDLVDAGEDRLEVAEALQQIRGGLVADAGDAGDVVARVALEADEVGDQLGRDAVALDDALAVVDLRVRDAPRGGHDPHAVADQLVRVAVAGDDHHRDAALLGLADERSRSRRRPRSPRRRCCGSRTPRRAAGAPATAASAGRGARSAGPCSRRRSPCGRTSPRPTPRRSAPRRSR